MAGPKVRIPCDMITGSLGLQASAQGWYRSQLPLDKSWFTASSYAAYLEVNYENNYGSQLTCSLYYDTTANGLSGTKVCDFTLDTVGATAKFYRSSDIWSSLYGSGLAYYWLYTPAAGTTALIRMMRIVIELDGVTAAYIPISLVACSSSSSNAGDTTSFIRATAGNAYPSESNSDCGSNTMAASSWYYDASEWADVQGFEIDYLAYSSSTSASREGVVGVGAVGTAGVVSGTEQIANLDVTAPRIYRITGLASNIFTDHTNYQGKAKNENASYQGRLPGCRIWVKLSNASGLSLFNIYEPTGGQGYGNGASNIERTKGKWESSKWNGTGQTTTIYFESTCAQDTASPQNGIEIVDDDSDTGGTYNTEITGSRITPTASSTYNVDPARVRTSSWTFPNDNYYYYMRRLATTTATYYPGAFIIYAVSWVGGTTHEATIDNQSLSSVAVSAPSITHQNAEATLDNQSLSAVTVAVPTVTHQTLDATIDNQSLTAVTVAAPQIVKEATLDNQSLSAVSISSPAVTHAIFEATLDNQSLSAVTIAVPGVTHQILEGAVDNQSLSSVAVAAPSITHQYAEATLDNQSLTAITVAVPNVSHQTCEAALDNQSLSAVSVGSPSITHQYAEATLDNQSLTAVTVAAPTITPSGGVQEATLDNQSLTAVAVSVPSITHATFDAAVENQSLSVVSITVPTITHATFDATIDNASTSYVAVSSPTITHATFEAAVENQTLTAVTIAAPQVVSATVREATVNNQSMTSVAIASLPVITHTAGRPSASAPSHAPLEFDEMISTGLRR